MKYNINFQLQNDKFNKFIKNNISILNISGRIEMQITR